MTNIKIYQSSKYKSKQYKIVNFIYYFDTVADTYNLPLYGYMERFDKLDDIIYKLCEKFNVECNMIELIQIETNKIALFELAGSLQDLIKTSDIIGKTITPIYVNENIMDLYIN